MKTSALSELHTICHNIEYAPENKDSFGHELINHSVYLTSWEFVTVRVFSRDIVLEGKLLLWGEKCEKYPKNERNLLLFGGKIQNLGGKFPPLKALKKHW